jgi:hypothetical protein
MAPKRKPSSKPVQSSEVSAEVQEEVKSIPATEVKTYLPTGKFYAKDGYVIGQNGKIVSKKMEQTKAEDIAQKFNK